MHISVVKLKNYIIYGNVWPDIKLACSCNNQFAKNELAYKIIFHSHYENLSKHAEFFLFETGYSSYTKGHKFNARGNDLAKVD